MAIPISRLWIARYSVRRTSTLSRRGLALGVRDGHEGRPVGLSDETVEKVGHRPPGGRWRSPTILKCVNRMTRCFSRSRLSGPMFAMVCSG